MAFMGTKQRRDLVANAQVIQDPVWPEDAAILQDSASQVHCSVRLPTLKDPNHIFCPL